MLFEDESVAKMGGFFAVGGRGGPGQAGVFWFDFGAGRSA